MNDNIVGRRFRCLRTALILKVLHLTGVRATVLNQTTGERTHIDLNDLNAGYRLLPSLVRNVPLTGGAS